MLVTAASELARNALIYGGGGTVTWEVRRDGPKVGVQLTFEDRGPGIPDLRLAMTPGWTSGTGMALGLSGAKRLVDEFSIGTVIGVGTRVTVEITRAMSRAG
jgi:serine/threonine-protein kinase RsbT